MIKAALFYSAKQSVFSGAFVIGTTGGVTWRLREEQRFNARTMQRSWITTSVTLPSTTTTNPIVLRIDGEWIAKRRSVIAPNLRDNFPTHPNSGT